MTGPPPATPFAHNVSARFACGVALVCWIVLLPSVVQPQASPGKKTLTAAQQASIVISMKIADWSLQSSAMQSSANVPEAGESLSNPTSEIAGWPAAVVPGTVLGAAACRLPQAEPVRVDIAGWNVEHLASGCDHR
jgi:hypothetical protein